MEVVSYLPWVLMAFDQEFREENQVALYDQFNKFLIDQFSKNKRTVLIIDEAQNLHPHILEELRMLSNINADKYQVLQMILVGQPQLLDLLKRPELEQFRQRVTSDYYLKALDRDETAAYIKHRVSYANVKRKIFDDKAVDLIFRASKGVPRIINVICDMALVYGFAEQLKQIDEAIIQSVLNDKAESGLLEMDASVERESADSSQAELTQDKKEARKKPEKPKLDRDTVKHLFSKD